MENSYGIGVQNRYGLFSDEEGDPFDLMKNPAAQAKGSEEKENKDKGRNKVANKKNNKVDTVTKIEKNAVTGKGQQSQPQQQSGGQQRNGENRVKFSDREERNNRRNRQDAAGPKDSTNGSSGQRFDDERPRRFDNDRPPRRFDNDRPPRRFDEDGAPRRFNEGGPRRFNDGERRFDGEGGRGRGRGMGRGGRGRGGPGGKREFDRHSGSERSGVKPVDKRDGSGSYNWGSAKDQIEETQITDQLQATELDTSTEDKEKHTTSAGEEGGASENESGGEGATAPKEDEERKEMTLDEYKALQKANRVKPEFKLRKAGEGENSAQWTKTYVLKKKDVDSEEEEEEESSEESAEEPEEHHNKRKVILDIDFQFSDSPMRGRGRGRGRGMGGRGRGEGRFRGGRGGMGGFNRGGGGGGRNARQEAPKMDDEGDFPTLKLGK